MNKKIVALKFYKSESEKEPVKEWLMTLKREDRKIIGSDIKTVEFGFPIGMPLVKKIDNKYKLFEVRSDLTQNKISRVIFTIYKKEMVLLHAFIKKTQKMPEKEKETSIKRLKKFNLGGLNEK